MANELLYLTKEYTVTENEHQTYSFFFDHTTQEKNITLSFFIERNATLTLQLLLVDSSINLQLHYFLNGHGASVIVNGACIVSQSHKTSITTVQHHQAAHTQSSLSIKGLVYNNAHMEYHGTITIEQNAHTTSASQENKNIIMSESARVISVPNLQVLNNEVKCFHASAIGSLDQQQLFYLLSRGINEKTAEKILLQAFFSELYKNNEMQKQIDRVIHEH